jgi:hypothetical protein
MIILYTTTHTRWLLADRFSHQLDLPHLRYLFEVIPFFMRNLSNLVNYIPSRG